MLGIDGEKEASAKEKNASIATLKNRGEGVAKQGEKGEKKPESWGEGKRKGGGRGEVLFPLEKRGEVSY